MNYSSTASIKISQSNTMYVSPAS